MSNILITGASGNVSHAVIKHLMAFGKQHTLFLASRKQPSPGVSLVENDVIRTVFFDFESQGCFESTLTQIDYVFLLRPPQLTDMPGIFEPLCASMKRVGVKGVVFLSVQGVERSKFIPHHKIEALLEKYDLPHVNLRPGYFMQNLTTTLLPQLVKHRALYLPAGKAKFNWVDVDNVGEVAAVVLNNFDRYAGKHMEITGDETLSFEKAVDKLASITQRSFTYKSVTPWRFLKVQKQLGTPKGMRLVMLMLHFLPRFQAVPKLSPIYHELTGKSPTSLETFIKREKDFFTGSLTEATSL